MTLSLTREAQRVMERVFLVTGAMRTGSTMLGRLLRSMQQVEAFHEPGVVYSLFPLITKIDSNMWKLLFSTSVFEDCLIRSLNATAINMNKFDESWIGYSLDDAEQTARMTSTLDREDLVKKSTGLAVCIKVPEMTPYLPDFRRIFPESQIIVTVRRPERVITSLVRKGYFTDERFFKHPKKWPNYIRDGRAYPFWLPESRYAEWGSMSEFSRCCLCFSFQYDNYVLNEKDLILTTTPSVAIRTHTGLASQISSNGCRALSQANYWIVSKSRWFRLRKRKVWKSKTILRTQCEVMSAL